MADNSISFQESLVQLGGEDFLRDLTEFMLNRIMEADVAQRINAERHERTDERETYRNGFRDRQFNTRLGTLDLRIPKLLTRGRPREGVIPSSTILLSSVQDFIGAPLSECKTSGCRQHCSRSAVRCRSSAASSPRSCSWTSQPTPLRL
jgi:hypothetical protein